MELPERRLSRHPVLSRPVVRGCIFEKCMHGGTRCMNSGVSSKLAHTREGGEKRGRHSRCVSKQGPWQERADTNPHSSTDSAVQQSRETSSITTKCGRRLTYLRGHHQRTTQRTIFQPCVDMGGQIPCSRSEPLRQAGPEPYKTKLFNTVGKTTHT